MSAPTDGQALTAASPATKPRAVVPLRLRRRMEQPPVIMAVMAVLVVAIIVWASLATVDRIVRVEGRIIPAGRSQTIQHLEGGIVASINTNEGANVHKGDVLLVIDNTSIQASLSETQLKIDGLRIRAARLEAEANGQENFSVTADLKDRRELVETEQQLFRLRRQKMEQERTIFEEQIRQRNAEISEIANRRARLKSELETARKRLELFTHMAAKAAASNLEVLEAQSREQRLASELGDAEGAIPKIQAAIGEAQARASDVRNRYRTEAQGDLSTTLLEVDRLQKTATAQADRNIRTEVRAPVDGIINKLNVTTIGGVVKPGDTIIEITPTTEHLQLETKARPSDRGELQTGLPAKIRISAYDVGELGILHGHVAEVSSDTVQDAKGDPYYRVVIAVDQLPDSYAGHPIIPGMTVTGDVVIGQRTVMKYITSPFTKFAYNAFRDPR